MKLFKLPFVILLITSCGSEIEKLRVENRKLVHQNDSLIQEVDKFKLLPYLEPLKFQTTVHDTFYTKALLVQKDGFVKNLILLCLINQKNLL